MAARRADVRRLARGRARVPRAAQRPPARHRRPSPVRGPVAASWTLPVYELALLTSAWCADEGVIGAHFALATPEEEPLRAFGPAAACAVRDLLSDRGIELLTRHHGAERRARSGAPGPRPDPRGRPGRDAAAPAGRRGSKGCPPTATGSCPWTSTPRWRGSRASTRSGTRRRSRSSRAAWRPSRPTPRPRRSPPRRARPVDAEPFTPVMRGLLLTGIASAYLRVELDAPERSSRLDWDSLWWPADESRRPLSRAVPRGRGGHVGDAAGAPRGLLSRTTRGRSRRRRRPRPLRPPDPRPALLTRRARWRSSSPNATSRSATGGPRCTGRRPSSGSTGSAPSRSNGRSAAASATSPRAPAEPVSGRRASTAPWATRARSRRRGRRRPPGRRAGARPGRRRPRASCRASR